MRRAPALLALFVVALLGLRAQPATAQATGAEARFVALLNGARSSAGLAPLVVAPDLTALARQRAADLASAGRIYHQSLDAIDGQHVGENVGMGRAVETVHRLFMASATHRANIEGGYSEMGIGVVYAGGDLYVDELYRMPWDTVPTEAASPAGDLAATPEPEPDPQVGPSAQAHVELPLINVVPTTLAAPTTTVAPSTLKPASAALPGTEAIAAIPHRSGAPDVSLAAIVAGFLAAAVMAGNAWTLLPRPGDRGPRTATP